MRHGSTMEFLAISGSLRRDAFSTAVLTGIAARLPSSARLTFADIRLPLYNEDEDGDATPPSVTAFREAIGCSAGLIISTPEYNHGLPGGLKNALDWASRPFGASVLLGKPVLTISTSLAFTGGVRAQAQLNETLLSVGSRIVPGPQNVIGNIGRKVENGVLVDEASLSFLLQAFERLIAVASDRP